MIASTSPNSVAQSPLDSLLRAYDQAIAACRSRRSARAYQMIAILREAHPCDSPAAAGIDALYASCERSVLSGDFLGAARILDQLRTAWESADRITTPPSFSVRESKSVMSPHDAPEASRRG